MEGYEVCFVFVFWIIAIIIRRWKLRGHINLKFEIKFIKVDLKEWKIK